MAGTERIDFLSNASAGNGAAKTWKGGKLAFIAEATWSSGSVNLQIQSSNGTWIDVPNSTLSANGMAVLDLPPGQYRGVVDTSSAVYAYGVQVPTIR